MQTQSQKTKDKARRMPKILSEPLYAYVEPANGKHARTFGKKTFGSFSSYVNVLIAKDRGVKPNLGSWKLDKEKGRMTKATIVKRKSKKAKN